MKTMLTVVVVFSGILLSGCVKNNPLSEEVTDFSLLFEYDWYQVTPYENGLIATPGNAAIYDTATYSFQPDSFKYTAQHTIGKMILGSGAEPVYQSEQSTSVLSGSLVLDASDGSLLLGYTGYEANPLLPRWSPPGEDNESEPVSRTVHYTIVKLNKDSIVLRQVGSDYMGLPLPGTYALDRTFYGKLK